MKVFFGTLKIRIRTMYPYFTLCPKSDGWTMGRHRACSLLKKSSDCLGMICEFNYLIYFFLHLMFCLRPPFALSTTMCSQEASLNYRVLLLIGVLLFLYLLYTLCPESGGRTMRRHHRACSSLK